MRHRPDAHDDRHRLNAVLADVDYAGLAALITAVGAGIAAVVTAFSAIANKRREDREKAEAEAEAEAARQAGTVAADRQVSREEHEELRSILEEQRSFVAAAAQEVARNATRVEVLERQRLEDWKQREADLAELHAARRDLAAATVRAQIEADRAAAAADAEHRCVSLLQEARTELDAARVRLTDALDRLERLERGTLDP